MLKTNLFVQLIKGYEIKQLIRKLSVAATQEKQKPHKIQAWQIHSYGNVEELQLTPARIPHIREPTELLIKVEAASVNPIDKLMMAGYGKSVLGLFRGYELEFPLTLGRDFCGTVVNKGLSVGNEFQIGDKVYGIIPLHKQGSLAEIVTTDKSYVCTCPSNLTAVEAASIPYAALTAWSALFLTGELFFRQANTCRVLILGASGGVGTLALQILKSQGATVVGTCSGDAMPLVQSLGADAVFDYSHQEYLQNVASEGKFDIILDCARFGHQNIPDTWKFHRYITLNSPLLVNTDKYGIVGGLAASTNDLICSNFVCKSGKSIRWGFFIPSTDGLKFVDKLVKSGKVRPVVHKSFKFIDVPNAFETLAAGHLRGKIVIDLADNVI